MKTAVFLCQLEFKICLYHFIPLILCCWSGFSYLPWGFQSSWISVQWTGKRTWQQTPGWPCWRWPWGSRRTRSFCGEKNAQKAVKIYTKTSVFIYCFLCVFTVPVSLAVVQSAAGPEGLVVVLSPADEGHGGPEGSEEPDEDSQSDGAAPLQLCPWRGEKVQKHIQSQHL